LVAVLQIARSKLRQPLFRLREKRHQPLEGLVKDLRVALVMVIAVALGGCASDGGGLASDSSPSPSPVRVIDPYELSTHCGVREARIGDDFYVATPQLIDGNGSPPEGWANPGMSGVMTVYDNGTARFAAGSVGATFTLRLGATDWLGPICS
jgi:hypothetical protein